MADPDREGSEVLNDLLYQPVVVVVVVVVVCGGGEGGSGVMTWG